MKDDMQTITSGELNLINAEIAACERQRLEAVGRGDEAAARAIALREETLRDMRHGRKYPPLRAVP